MRVATPRRSPGIGVWLAITASAIAGVLALTRRVDFDAANLLTPVVVGVLAIGVVATLQEFGPPRLRALARDQRFLLAFAIGLTALVVVWVLVTRG